MKSVQDLLDEVKATREAGSRSAAEQYGALVRGLALGEDVPPAGKVSALLDSLQLEPEQLAAHVATAKALVDKHEAASVLPQQLLDSARLDGARIVADARVAAARARLGAAQLEAREASTNALHERQRVEAGLSELLGGPRAAGHVLSRRVSQLESELRQVVLAIAHTEAREALGEDASFADLGQAGGAIEDLRARALGLADQLGAAIDEAGRLEHLDWTKGGRVDVAEKPKPASHFGLGMAAVFERVDR